ncbi:MAG: fibronectin type III domain-containing protein, partial [Bacteroidota bacterium]
QATQPLPTLAPGNISVSDLGSNTATLSVTPGDGIGRLIVMKAGSPVDFVPDQVTSYSVSSSFGGRDLGNQNFGIGRLTTGTTQSLRNLAPNTTYHVAVFEYNGSSNPAYLLTPTVFSFTTPRYPTVNASNLTAQSIGATQLNFRYSRGNGGTSMVVVRPASAPEVLPADNTVYVPNNRFGDGDAVGPQNFVVELETTSFTSFNLTGLLSGTEYVITVYERARNATETFYAVPGASLTVSTVARPTVDPVNLQVNNISPNEATIAWTTGNGAGEAVLVSANAPVDTFLQDGLYYSPRTDFANARQVGNARSVFFGTTTFVDLRTLTPGTPYYVQLQAYNGTSQSPAYRQAGPTTVFRTPGPPSLQAVDANVTFADATRISFDWTNGNGIGRIVLGKAGGPVDAVPVDGTNYFPNTFFGSGDEIGTGNFVIAVDDLDTLTVSNLTPGEIYHFAVFEYNRAATNPLVNTLNPARTSVEAALPVTWASFNVRPESKGAARLDWVTSQEENTASFLVEHRTNGRDFRPVGELPARGFSSHSVPYTFLHRGLAAGTHFYRLRQVDLDGAFGYSEVRSLVLTAGDAALVTYPNPVTDRLYLTVEEPVAYRIIDLQGKEVSRG